MVISSYVHNQLSDHIYDYHTCDHNDAMYYLYILVTPWKN
jgi:hypothetical protein